MRCPLILRMKYLIMGFVLLMLVSVVYADHPETFPEWTYWVEIIEHFGTVAAALVALIFLMPHSKKSGMNYVLAGLVLLLISQILLIMHHFLIHYAGIYTAIAHHGLLLIAVIFLIFGMHKSVARK